MKPKNNKKKRRAMPLLVGVGIGYAELFLSLPRQNVNFEVILRYPKNIRGFIDKSSDILRICTIKISHRNILNKIVFYIR